MPDPSNLRAYVVRRAAAGESVRALARRHDLPASTAAAWVRRAAHAAELEAARTALADALTAAGRDVRALTPLRRSLAALASRVRSVTTLDRVARPRLASEVTATADLIPGPGRARVLAALDTAVGAGLLPRPRDLAVA